MKDHYGCPVQASINVLSGKWKVQILWHLSFGPRRFAEIRKKLPKISEKVLTDQLRQRERDGVCTAKLTHPCRRRSPIPERRGRKTRPLNGISLQLGQRAFRHQAQPAAPSGQAFAQIRSPRIHRLALRPREARCRIK
jgi:hypothetical protein